MTRLLLLLFCAAVTVLLCEAQNDLFTVTIQSSGDIDNVCSMLGPFAPLPFVETEALCDTAGFIDDPKNCGILEMVEKSLPRMASSSGGRLGSCRGERQSPAAETSLQGTPLPAPLSDQRPLPEELPIDLFESEGATYHFLWKNVLNFQRWSGCAASSTPRTVTRGTPVTGNATLDWLVPQGWNVHSTIWQGNGSTEDSLNLPLATVMHKPGSIVILIRGAKTMEDWRTSFDYNYDAATSRLQVPGAIHRGFARLAASAWPALRSALQSLMEDNAGGASTPNVYVTGHSLGAGLASLVAYMAQDFLGPQVKLDAVLFAPPTVGNAAFAAAYGSKVNSRRIVFTYDLVPQLPCTPTTVGCPHAPIPTPNPQNGGLWQYTAVPGNLIMQPSDMPHQAHAWSLMDKIHPCQVTRFFQATHTCSYNCYLSQYVVDGNNLCQLWPVQGGNNTAGTTGTYCNGFPDIENVDQQYPFQSQTS